MRTRNLWAAATLSVLLMAACTDLESPLAGRIWSPPQDRWLGEAELTAKMLAADAS